MQPPLGFSLTLEERGELSRLLLKGSSADLRKQLLWPRTVHDILVGFQGRLGS